MKISGRAVGCSAFLASGEVIHRLLENNTTAVGYRAGP